MSTVRGEMVKTNSRWETRATAISAVLALAHTTVEQPGQDKKRHNGRKARPIVKPRTQPTRRGGGDARSCVRALARRSLEVCTCYVRDGRAAACSYLVNDGRDQQIQVGTLPGIAFRRMQFPQAHGATEQINATQAGRQGER